MTRLLVSTVAFLLSFFSQGVVRIPGPGGMSPLSGNTFTKVIVANVTCSSSPCTITHTFTAGNGVEIIFSSITTSDFITAVSGGGTWTIPTACQQNDSSAGAISAAYITSNSGTTSLSVSFTSASGLLTYAEFSASPGPITFDGCGKADRNSGSTTQSLISPTLTGTNDAIFQGITASQTVNSFTTAYTTSQGGGTFGSVYIFNSNTTVAPVANLAASGVAVVNELAFR